MELSAGDAQVLITTHSPYFIDVEHYEGIKMFRNHAGEAKAAKSSFSTILTEYNAAFAKPLKDEDQARTKLAIQTQPKFNEGFFADKVVLVEGISDQACLETFLRLSERKPEFQKSGTAFVVCEGKSSLALMLLIARHFGIPYHVIFDGDAGSDAKYHAAHIQDNDAIFVLAGHAPLGALPTDHVFKQNLAVWVDTIERVLEDEYAADSTTINQAGCDAVGHLKSSKKNPIYIAAAMKAAWDGGRSFPVLDSVINDILK